MKKTNLRYGLILALIAASASHLWADVVVTEPTGGNNVPADKALNSTNGAGFTALGNIVIAEGVNTDFANGTNVTLILTPPDGWQFNPGVGSVSYTAGRNLSAASITVTSDSVTVKFTVSGTPALDTMTISGLQVQAFDGLIDPYAFTLITCASWNPGTAVIAGIQEDGTSFGQLYELAGAARVLTFQTTPSSTASAGVIFDQQPVLNVLDQFGNLRELDGTTVVTASRDTGAGILQGTLTQTAEFGVVSYADLSHNVMGTITIRFTSPGLTGVTSDPIAVGPGTASQLVFTTQPAAAAVGALFGVQPVIKSRDQFGNDSTVGLASSQIVTLTAAAGTGPLLGTTSLDIGTGAGNGTVTFTNLEIDSTGTNKQLTASSPGFGNSSSAVFTVTPGAFSQLQILMPGETAAPGTPSGKTGSPITQTAGTAFSVSVRAVDAYWNLVGTNDTVTIGSSDGNAVLPLNAALVNGTNSFSVTLKTAGNPTVTATDVTHSGITAAVSSAIPVVAGALSKLQILAPGESAAPGSATGKTGTPTAQAAGSPINLIVNAVDANWNVVNTNDSVSVRSSDPNAVLPATGALANGTRLLSVTFKTAGNRTVTVSNVTHTAITSSTTPAIAVGPGAFSKLQLLVPGETAAPGTVAGKSGTATVQAMGTAFTLSVNAVDDNWNLVSNITDAVGFSSSDSLATLPSSTLLVAGQQTLNATFNSGGSQTVTASDLSSGGIQASTSSTVSVLGGGFSKLQVLLPGETAAPGTPTGKSGTPTAQAAGASFVITVNAVDQNWNVISTNDTVALTSSDANAVLPPNAVLVNGTKTFSVTLKTAGGTTMTAADVTQPGIANNTSSALTVNAGAFTKLQLLTPGETAAPGSATGKTGTPSGQTAGSAFNVTVNAVDNFWNSVTNVSQTVGLSSSDNNATLPANTALVSGTRTFSVTLNTAGSPTLTATDITDGTKTNSISPAISVSTGAFAKLQILVPGETAAPGTASGKSGTATARTAGTAFTVTVNAVDANWNLISTNDTVGITSSDANAALPASAPLAGGSGVFSVTLKTAGTSTVTASDATHPAVANSTSPALTVNPTAVVKLQLLLPGETAAPGTATGKTGSPSAQTAGTALLNGVRVNAVDANWNIITSSVPNIIITTSDSSAAIADDNGATSGNLTLAAGTRALSSLTFKTVGTRTVTATDAAGTLTASTSSSVSVNVGAYAKLQLLMPGESAAPGTGTGKTGTPAAQNVNSQFSVTVNAVDANWNPVSTVSDLVGITSSDAAATLPANANLVSGTQSFNVIFNTAGSQTVTASDLTDGSKTSSTSPVIAVGTVQYTAASGGGAISADSTGGTSTPLTGPSYAEKVPGQVSTGTIVLNAPSGFVFDTGGTAPTVLIQRVGGSGSANINGAGNNGTTFSMTSVTTTQLVFTVTSSSSGSTYSKMTWQNVRVRPTAGTPLAAGNLRMTGTASLVTVTTNSTFGSLQEIPGAAGLLGIQTQPSATATAGVMFAQQPVIQVQDQFGNLRSAANGLSDNSTVVTATRSAGNGTLMGTTSATASDGIVTFSTLRHNVANDITLAFSASGATGATSTLISVSPAAASALAFTTQPGNATAGANFSTQPVVKSQDVFGNNSTNGLPASLAVSLALNPGGGLLQGTTAADIGTAAGNGIAAFTDLRIDNAGTNKQLTASASGLGSAASSTFTVAPLAAAALVIQTQPPSAATAGAAFAAATVVRLVDAFGNPVTTDSSTVVAATRSAGTAALQGTTSATVSNGLATFANLSYTKAETITIGFSSGSLAGATSSNVTVNPAAANKLTILTPASSTATAGVLFAQQPAIRIEDAFGNLRSGDSGTYVTATRASGSGNLQGTTTVTATNGVATFTDLSHNVATNITLQFASSGLTNATSGTIAVSPGAASKLTIQTQPSTNATAGVVFAQQPVVRVEDQFGNVVGSDNSTSVTAARGSGTGTLQGTTAAVAANGMVSFTNLSHNVATNITIVFSSGILAGATTTPVAVSAAVPATAGYVQSPVDAVAGAVINPPVTVRLQDSFGNSLSGLPVSIALSTGTGTLSGTTTRTTDAGGLATFNDLSVNLVGTKKLTATAGALGTGESTPFVITPAASSLLAIQTQPSATATAGLTFGQQPVIQIQDVFGNLQTNDNTTIVTAARAAGSGTLQGTITATAVNGIATFTSLAHNVATNVTIQFSSGSLSNATSTTIAVSPGTFATLQLLVPGVTAAPGTVTGKTGTPTARTAGTAFSVTANAVDSFWNIVSTNDTVALALSDPNATAPANAALVNGSQTFNVTFKTAGSQTVGVSDVTHPAMPSDNSPAMTVNPGAATKLQLLLPGESAAPGTATGKSGSPASQSATLAIANGIIVNAVDANWNVVATATPNVAITSTDPNAIIADDNGATSGNMTLVSGTRTLSSLTFRTAGARTVTASDPSGTLTASTSPSLTIQTGPFVQLQLLVPGETAAAGTTAGKTGTPTARTAGVPFSVSARGVDAAWNVVTNVTDMVGITSSDVNASLPVAAHLAQGAANFNITLKTIGNWTIAATDLTDGSKTANTSPSISVTAPQFTVATGGGAISADTTGGSYTSLTGPTYTENNAGEVGTGTIILNAPAGFVFDTGGSAPTVSSVKIGGAGNTPVAGSVTSVTSSQIVYNVTAISGNPSLLTWQNVRVRPAAGTPLAIGSITRSGTASVVGMPNGANLGVLSEVPGVVSASVIQTQPSASATAGVAFVQQPVLRLQDQFGNFCTNNSSTVITAARNAGSGTLQGTTAMTAINGVVTFTNLAHTVATNITVDFSAPSVTTVTSTTIAISPAAATALAFATQPGNATAGSPFGTQPVVVTCDAFGNATTTGVPANLNVSLTAGANLLQGTTTLDIGLGAGNGVVAFTNLRIDAAGSNKQLTASAGGLSSAVSSAFTVSPSAAVALVIQTQPPASATAGAAFSPAPAVRLLDAYGNLATTDNTTVVTATRNAGSAALQGTTSATASSGVATFANLSYTKAETITIAFTSGSLSGATSGSVTVNPAAANRLTILTQPSAAATAGAAFAQQPALRVEDAYGNLRSSDNATVITAARNAGSGTLQGGLTATATSGVATFTTLAHNVATNITINFTASGLAGATSDPIAVNPAAFAKLQLLVPGESAAPGSASGKTGTPVASTAGTAFNVTANAVDAFWNLVNTVTDTVDLSCTDTNAVLPADTALINGTRLLSVTFKTASSQTLTATDASDGSKGSNTSPSITVNAGAFAKMQLIMPGETAVPGTSMGKTGSPSAQTAGTSYSVTVRAVDSNWNLVSSANTVGINSTDPNDVLPANAALSAGSRTFSLTNNTAGSWTVVATNITDGTKTSDSSPVTVNAGAFTKLQLLAPGEVSAPGSATGKTGTPAAQTASQPFNVTVNAVDANWNVISSATDTIGITTTDANDTHPANAALAAGTQTFAVTFKTAGSWTVTATDTTNGSKTANTSPAITVNAGAFAKLQLLVPGETAAPGSATGKTGTPTVELSGTAFNTIVRAVDADWNLVSSTHTVAITSSDSNATLPGNTALVAGIKTNSVTFRTLPSQTLTASDVTDGTKTANTSPAITVIIGVATNLAIATQPSATAIAGTVFAQQPVIRVEDGAGHLVGTNGLVITAARSAGAGTLQGALTATTVNGIATFTNLWHNLATNITISFTAGSLVGTNSDVVAVSPAAFAKLQLLVPGETAAPGSASGKTGTPGASTAGTAFNVTVNAVDAFWNLVNTVTDTVDISSTDTNAVLPADTALISGTKLLSVTLKTASSQTLTATDASDGSKNNNTSPTITVNPGAFAKMQLIMPGETAAPGSATGTTGSPSAQSAGAGYSVTVRAVDSNWNLVSSTNTAGITCTDPNDVLPANAALSAGSRTFSLTNKTAGNWTVVATNITDGTKASDSSPVSVNVGAFAKLQLLVPGEVSAPGSAAGKTGTPSAQTASQPFTMTVNAVDANWNLVTNVADTAGITSSDANATLPGSTALTSGTQTLSVTLHTAGTRTLTASDLSDGTKTASTSPSITVNAGAFVKLQLIVPGETAAPGSATGKTGTPTAAASGTAFNAIVRAVDADWNVVSSTHTVALTSSDTNATLPGNTALVAGIKTNSVTLRTLGSQIVTATDVTDGTKMANASPAIAVNVGTASKLTIATQPSSTAQAGVVFAQQPVIRVEDAAGNLVSTNGLIITAVRSAGTGTLQGTVTATTVNGVATFTNLSYNVVQTMTINFTASGLTSATSGNVVVSAGPVSQLTFTTQPAGLRTGSPLATQPVVKSQDAFGNNSAVGLPASLTVSLALTGGTGSLLGTTNLDIGTAAGNGTVTFTNVQCSDAGTNKQITASATGLTSDVSTAFFLGGVERATGGSAILSSTAGGSFTTLTGPTYWEASTGDVGTTGSSTIVLNAPGGFNFDTGGTAPTVIVTRTGGGGNDTKNINSVASGTAAAISSRTTTQITFTVANGTSGGVTNAITWQNVRVRPTLANPIASGDITNNGTATLPGTTSSTSFGRLIEVPLAMRLAIQTQPSSTTTAGVTFAQQPVIRIEDSFGNLVTTDNSTVVTASRSAGAGTLQGALTARATNGLATFSNLSHLVATNISILFTGGTLTNVTSGVIAVSPAAANQLVFTTQPANGTVGQPLATQPVVRSRDPFGNDSTVGLGANKNVTMTLSSGFGPLVGTTSRDIGTSAGNGVITFTDLRIDSAGTNNQLTASASGLSNAASSFIAVAKGSQTLTFGVLGGKTYGDAPFALTASASSGLPVSYSIASGPATLSGGNLLTLTGAGTVTVIASQAGDGNWNVATNVNESFSVAPKLLMASVGVTNKVYDGTAAATIATRTVFGVVGGDNVSLTGGTATFANKNAGAGKTVSITGLSLAGTAAGNYQLASSSTTNTADITARALTVTLTAANKVYDGAANATLNLGSATLAGVVGGDSVTLATSGVVAAFADANTGTNKTVAVSGLSLSGADAGNYQLAATTAALTASILPRALVVSATGVDREYDGTTNATVTLSDDRIAGDTFTDSFANASFADKNVGTNKTVTVNGIVISGASAANYAVNGTATTTAAITNRTLTITVTAENKVYDGTTDATVTLSDDRIAGDDLTAGYEAASFADKSVGANKPVTVTDIVVSGADAGNYTVNTTTDVLADITVRPVTVSGVTAADKVYDGGTHAVLNLAGAVLEGMVNGDDVTLDSTSAAGVFADANAGLSKTVQVSGLSLLGLDAGNYQLTATSANTSASITARALVVGATGVDRLYDGTTNAAVLLSDNRLAGELLTVSYTGASFDDKNVGTNKTVTVRGIAISGASAANYAVNGAAATTAAITNRALTITVTAENKVYDGTTDATVTLSDDRIAGDDLTAGYEGASFADKSVGANKTVTVTGFAVSGADAGNYTVNTTTNTLADITVRPVTVSGVAAADKVYDGGTHAVLNLAGAVLEGMVSGDDLTLDSTSAAGVFADPNTGLNKTVQVSGLSLSGADAGNYQLTAAGANTTASITVRALVVGATGVDRAYDGTTNAAVLLSDNRLAGDLLTLGYTGASFDDKNAGTNKTVTVRGVTISGASAPNYAVNTTAATTAAITARALTVTVAGENKVYDGTTDATLTLSDDRIAGDDLTAGYEGASFADRNVGANKIVTVTGFAVSGADAANYTVNTTTNTVADITVRLVTVSGVAAADKVYDGGNHAVLNLAGAVLEGMVSGDDVTLDSTSAAGVFADPNTGLNKTVQVSGLSLLGADAGNYQLTATSANTTASITARALVVGATGVDRAYDGTANATVLLSDNRLAGEMLTVSYTGASFDDKNVGANKTVTVTGIAISGPGAANYTVNTTAAATAAITARALTISATAENKVYDGTTGATVTLADDRVAGDSLTNSYTAASFDDKNVGTNKVVTVSGIAVSGADAGNYTLGNATATTVADILAATSPVTLFSSLNPSGYRDSVYFTATNVPTDASLSVVFMTNGVAFSTNALSGGSANSLSLTNLPRGTNLITAVTIGDGNYTGLTNILSGGQVVTNHPPAASPATYERAYGTSIRISIPTLLTNSTSDPDEDARALVSVGASTNGSSITISGNFILFSATNNLPESFAYVVRDVPAGYQAGDPILTATNWITVGISNSFSAAKSIAVLGSGITVRFAGIPGYPYDVERSTDMNTWTVMQTTNAPAAGVWDYYDATPPTPQAFYRLKLH